MSDEQVDLGKEQSAQPQQAQGQPQAVQDSVAKPAPQSRKMRKLTEKYGEILWYDKRRRFGLKLSVTHYILTKDSIICRSGFFNICNTYVDLYHVIDKHLDEPFFQRIFGCSTVSVNSNDTDTPMLKITSVKGGYKLINLLKTVVKTEKKDMRSGVLDTDMSDWSDNEVH